MYLITRHVTKNLIFLTLGITFVLTLIIWLAQSLRFISMIVLRGVSLSSFLGFVSWALPDLILLALPIGFLMAVLFYYNKMVADHELVILKSAGCSVFFFLKPILWVGTVGVIFLYTVSLYFLPLSFQVFRSKEVAFRTHYSQAMIQEREFSTLGPLVIYAQEYMAGTVRGLFIYDSRDPKNPVTLIAEKAFILDDQDGLKIILIQGTRQTVSGGSHEPGFLQFDRYVLAVTPEITSAPLRKPYEMFLPELLQSSIQNAPDQKRYLTELYQRFLMPLFMMSFGILGALFLLGAPENRLGRQKAIAGAIITAFSIEISTFLLLQSHIYAAPFLGCVCVFLPVFWLIFSAAQQRWWKMILKKEER